MYPSRRALGIAVAAALAAAAPAHAFEIDTGNPDVVMRWDNTVRYNLGIRTQSQNSSIIESPNFDDGDRNFSNGSIVTNRFDLLSEFDVVYQRKFGARASLAAWYDFAYKNLDDTNTATANTLVWLWIGLGQVCLIGWGRRRFSSQGPTHSDPGTARPVVS